MCVPPVDTLGGDGDAPAPARGRRRSPGGSGRRPAPAGRCRLPARPPGPSHPRPRCSGCPAGAAPAGRHGGTAARHKHTRASGEGHMPHEPKPCPFTDATGSRGGWPPRGLGWACLQRRQVVQGRRQLARAQVAQLVAGQEQLLRGRGGCGVHERTGVRAEERSMTAAARRGGEHDRRGRGCGDRAVVLMCMAGGANGCRAGGSLGGRAPESIGADSSPSTTGNAGMQQGVPTCRDGQEGSAAARARAPSPPMPLCASARIAREGRAGSARHTTCGHWRAGMGQQAPATPPLAVWEQSTGRCPSWSS